MTDNGWKVFKSVGSCSVEPRRRTVAHAGIRCEGLPKGDAGASSTWANFPGRQDLGSKSRIIAHSASREARSTRPAASSPRPVHDLLGVRRPRMVRIERWSEGSGCSFRPLQG